jgi:gas vesicle structural protein
MPRKRKTRSEDWLFPKASVDLEEQPQSSLLDVVDSVLNKGAVVNGDLILGLANVDLIYARLSVLLTALDKVTGRAESSRAERPKRKKKKRGAR